MTMKKFIITNTIAYGLLFVASMAFANTNFAPTCTFSERGNRWVCANPANDFLRHGDQRAVEAPGDDGASADSSGDSGSDAGDPGSSK